MIEISPDEFTERHHQYAAEGLIYPQPEGSPLLEFAAGGRVLYLFDRCGPYAARPGAARVIVNGMLSRWDPSPLQRESLTVVGVSGVEGVGQVVDRPKGSVPTVVVQARLTLVLNSTRPLPELHPGDWISFATEPLLHGFTLGTPLR